MASINFYHLTKTNVATALPALAIKIQQQNAKAVLKAGSADRLVQLDAALWTFRSDSFLPHGMHRDNDDEWNAAQPLLLTTIDTRVNKPTFLVLVDGVTSPLVAEMERVLVLFDGHDPEAVSTARMQWKGWQGQQLADGSKHELAYFQQGEGGGWERKA